MHGLPRSSNRIQDAAFSRSAWTELQAGAIQGHRRARHPLCGLDFEHVCAQRRADLGPPASLKVRHLSAREVVVASVRKL